MQKDGKRTVRPADARIAQGRDFGYSHDGPDVCKCIAQPQVKYFTSLNTATRVKDGSPHHGRTKQVQEPGRLTSSDEDLPLRFLSVILKLSGQNALEEIILAPSRRFTNLLLS